MPKAAGAPQAHRGHPSHRSMVSRHRLLVIRPCITSLCAEVIHPVGPVLQTTYLIHSTVSCLAPTLESTGIILKFRFLQLAVPITPNF